MQQGLINQEVGSMVYNIQDMQRALFLQWKLILIWKICYRALILFSLFKPGKAFLLGSGSQVEKFSFLIYCYNNLLPTKTNSFRIMMMVLCLVTGWMASLSLVSALCNFSERGGSQRYIRSTTNFVMTSWLWLVWKISATFNIMYL